MNGKLRACVLGATGMVGRRFVSLLKNHPFFELSCLAASEKSRGKTYFKLLKEKGQLDFALSLDKAVSELRLVSSGDLRQIADKSDIVFSAVNMPKEETRQLEEALARLGLFVISNNSAHRWTEDVPLIIADVNPEHAELIHAQRKRLKTKTGFIIAKPNCSLQCFVPALTPLLPYGLEKINFVSFQAVSGSGKTLEECAEIQDNVLPFIPGEEEKTSLEPLKIWGKMEGEGLKPAENISISAQCLRVPVSDGHLAAVSFSTRDRLSKADILGLWEKARMPVKYRFLPSAPQRSLVYSDDDFFPQSKMTREDEYSMSVLLGRLREDELLDYKFIGASHNALRGAAKGALLAAEMLYADGYMF